MGRDIEKFCLSCGNCQMGKTSNQLKPSLLHNLPILSRWQSVGMDFVGPFPECEGYDYLWVIICRLMNQVHLTAITVRTTTELAWLYIRDIVRLHGMPESYPIATLSSLPNFGVNYIGPWAPNCLCRHCFTLKQMATLRELSVRLGKSLE